MSEKPVIECKPGGPYRVSHVATLVNSRGEALEAKPAMALCRCGGSASKPFCDGTHRKNGFSDAKLAESGAGKRVSYRGRSITVHDNRAICAHAGHCTEGLAAVFKSGAKPWIDADGAAAEAIVAAVRKCPSGALSYTLGAEAAPEAPGAPSITVSKDGPYEVEGIELAVDAWGEGADRSRYTLCRCGASRNKPFCDGSHWKVEFRDPAN